MQKEEQHKVTGIQILSPFISMWTKGTSQEM